MMEISQGTCLDILIQFLHTPKPDSSDEMLYCKVRGALPRKGGVV